jgi:hypothetical protein
MEEAQRTAWDRIGRGAVLLLLVASLFSAIR